MSPTIAEHPMLQFFRVTLPRLLFLSLALAPGAGGEVDWV
jgi:hypothetical protein